MDGGGGYTCDVCEGQRTTFSVVSQIQSADSETGSLISLKLTK